MKFSSFLVFICSLIWFDSDLILFATEMISTNHFQSAAFCDGWTRWNNIKEIKRVCLNAILTKPFVLLTKKILRGEGGGRCCCAVVESLFISIHKVFLGCVTHTTEKKRRLNGSSSSRDKKSVGSFNRRRPARWTPITDGISSNNNNNQKKWPIWLNSDDAAQKTTKVYIGYITHHTCISCVLLACIFIDYKDLSLSLCWAISRPFCVCVPISTNVFIPME